MIDVRQTTRSFIKPIALGLMAVSALAMIAADIINHTVLFRAGITGWLVGATTYVAGRTGITAGQLATSRDSGYDAGNADGYECGYEDGRKYVRPALIQSDGPRLKPITLGSAAHQLSE